MNKKVMAVLSMAVATTVLMMPGAAFAQAYDPSEVKTITGLASKKITASGTLASTTSLNVTLLNDNDGVAGLTFASDGSDLVVTAPETVKVEFNDNTLGYQAIIVSTNNTAYTGLGTGAGLVGVSDKKYAAPLHWVVTETAALASQYNEFTVFPAGTTNADGDDISGYVDNSTQPYVVDKSQTDFNTNGVIGYTSVIYDIDAAAAKLADRPVDNGSGEPRTVSNGEAFMRFAVDYHNAQPQSYATDSLTLELVTIS